MTLTWLLGAAAAQAQDKLRYGGELVFLVPSEPPSYDGHREGTFGTVHPLAPHYNTLLRIDPTDRTGTRPAPDLAESWTISPDGLIYTLKLRQGVRFHDGSLLSSRDVKASYDKLVFPPPDTISMRKGSYGAIEVVEAPDPHMVRFHLKWPQASFLVLLSSSAGLSDNNYSRYKDPVLDDLFLKQARAMDPEERKRYLRAFEKRLLDEEAHYIYTLQWHRIVPHSARLRGWTITPAHRGPCVRWGPPLSARRRARRTAPSSRPAPPGRAPSRAWRA